LFVCEPFVIVIMEEDPVSLVLRLMYRLLPRSPACKFISSRKKSPTDVLSPPIISEQQIKAVRANRELSVKLTGDPHGLQDCRRTAPGLSLYLIYLVFSSIIFIVPFPFFIFLTRVHFIKICYSAYL